MSNFMPTPTVAHPRKSGFSILLVDTLGKGVSELKEHLEQEGNQADAATNAFEMLEKIKTKAYDAVIFNTELVQKEDARLVETLTTRIPQVLMYENEDVIQVCDRTLEAIEEKRAIDELKVNEEKLQAMIEYAKDGIILFDEAGKITFWNRAAEQIFSYTAQEAIGKSIHILVPPERAKVFDEGRKRVFENVKAKGGNVFRSRVVEIPSLRKDGTVVPTEISMSILKVRDSWQGLAIIRDITDRKKNENEILLQKERLRATLTTSPDAIVIVDVQGNVVECNEATLKLFQYASIEEVLGKNSLKFIAPREHSRVLGELNQVMANRGQFGSQQFVARKKNGEEFLMEAAGSALRDHSGKILGAVLNLSDLTERKKTETEIKLQQERWQATLASSPDSIILTDMKSKIVDCNDATLKLLHYKSKAEVIGKNSIEFVKESSDQPEEFIRRALEQKGPITTDEFIGVKSDGEQFIGEASANILRDQSGHPLGLVVVTRDITERKKAEAALRNSEEQFRSLAENSPNMIFINQNGRIVYVNKESENTMGYTKEEYYAPDFNFMRLIAPEFKELVKTNFGKHLANQEIGPYESRLVTKKGQVKDVIINSRIIQYNGEPALLGIATDITERKKAELEAADAKEKFMVYVESSPVAIFVANPQGKYEYTNEAASKLLGYSREELLHMSIPQLSFEQDLPMALKKFAEVNETGRSLSEMTLKTKQGLPVYVILNAIKLPDGNLLAFCENVTERKKAEKEILIQTERVKATFSASPDAIISLDLKGNVSDCNEEALKLFHYPSKERLIGKNSLQLIKEADRQQASSDLQGVLQYNKAIRNREYIGLKANEEDVLLEVSVSILKDDSGHTAGLIATAKDITERKKTEEKIRLLSSVVEQTVEGIAVSDLKGQILFVNSAWLKMHNYNIHDQSLIGQEVMKFYCLPQIEAVEKIIGTESVFRGRMTHVRKDGTTFQTIATLSPLRNEEGKIIGIIHMAKNLTDIVRDIRDTRQISTCNGEKPAVAAV